MQGQVATTVLLPLVLAFIMFSLGLGLTGNDFRRIARQPRALLVGAICHFVLLPLVCFAMLKVFSLPAMLAVGFMIVAACPTGSTSNLLTYIARGDVALALSFTAVASVLTIFTLPLLIRWSMDHFLGASQTIHFPVADVMLQVFLMMGLPVALGMLVRRLQPARALQLEPIATKAATVGFVLIVIGALIKSWDIFTAHFALIAPLALGLNVCMLFIGFACARLARLSRPQSITLGIETAVQNATLAIVIGTVVLQQDVLAVPGAIYGVLMYAGGLAFAFFMRGRAADATAATPATASPAR
jgi:BASS family bile acid:Na+ symporter